MMWLPPQQRRCCVLLVWIVAVVQIFSSSRAEQQQTTEDQVHHYVDFENHVVENDFDNNEEDHATPHRRRRRLSAVSDEAYQEILKTNLENFQHAEEAVVLGPTSFPRPFEVVRKSWRTQAAAADKVVATHLTPALGKHRPDHDAVLLFAAEYPLSNYVLFIESLRATGYKGDIVLSVNRNDLKQPEIMEYLSWHAEKDRGVVVYTPRQVCYNMENEIVESAKGGIRTCQCHDLYGTVDPNDHNVVHPLEDPRGQRTLANIRYEVYSIMASNYNPTSWLMLIDARDTVFQADPFHHVPRQTDPTGRSGILYYFGENMDATRIGKSKANNKWIRTAYGDIIGDALSNKPTICSGATMGEQVAMEQYLRAMVSEADETGVVLMGSDQGFHNRLYYSRKLLNTNTIHDIVVFDQGTGIVNNMGALRTQALEEWGNGKIVEEHDGDGQDGYRILNWDGTLSPVVHQFDRHKNLSEYFYHRKGPAYLRAWRAAKKAD